MTTAVDTATGEIATAPMTIAIRDVLVGERARKDYGDLTLLKASISEHGVLQPIGIVEGNRLLFGGRRLQACRELGWERIPYVVPQTRNDAAALLKAERDENTCRKPMTPSELVTLAEQIEALERPAAQERAEAGRRRGGEVFAGREASGTTEPEASEGRAMDVAANAVGMSRMTYQRARLVVAVATDPATEAKVREVAQLALAQMDSGEISIRAAQHKVNLALGRSEDAVSPRIKDEPDDGHDKSRAAIAARIAQARDLAATGHTSPQIAKALGVSEKHTRELCRREGIEVHADKVVGKTRRLDPNRIVEQTVRAAEPDQLVEVINYADLDRELLGEWISSLSESLKALRRLKSTLEKELSRVTE